MIFSLKNLRTLELVVEGRPGMLPKEVLQKILENSKKLRYLSLMQYGNDLPENVGNLKHLRHLQIFGSSPLKKLPDSICKLYHLQVLYVPNYESVPKNLSELVSLRRFCFEKETLMTHIFNVGRLTSLQELSQFVVSTDQGHELHQLEKLNQLHGKICISGLENVKNVGDAAMAKMKEKKYLQGLKFEWNIGKRAADDFQLLDVLEPHPNISTLRISGYRGNKFPNWLLGYNSLRHLKSLTLEKCIEVEEIPSIHESLPNCRILNLFFLWRLKELPVLLLNLTKLVIRFIPKLGYFSEDDSLMKDKQFVLEVLKEKAERFKSTDIVRLDKYVKIAIILFIDHVWYASNFKLQDYFSEIKGDEPWKDDNSREQILDLWVWCTDHHLKTVFDKIEKSKLVLPRSLTSLEITSCSITSDALSNCLQSLDSLFELSLWGIQTITSLPSKEVLCGLENLRSLTIKDCFVLQSLGGIVALTSLTELTLVNCINLNVSYEPLPSSLEKLALHHSTIKVDVGPLSRLKKLSISSWDDGPLKGLNSLTELSELHVCAGSGSNGINISSPTDKYSSHLEMVQISNLLLLTEMLSDETISSLKALSIRGREESVVLTDSGVDQAFRSLVSMDYLAFHECNITRLPLSLRDLSSLDFMTINDCPNLDLELEELPENLATMRIKGCPILTEKFSKDGPYRVELRGEETVVRFPLKGR